MFARDRKAKEAEQAAKAATDNPEKQQAEKQKKTQFEKDAKAQEKLAKEARARAEEARKEAQRQRDINECLPLIREQQLRADSLRERMQQLVIETREHFEAVVAVLRSKHDEWAAIKEIQDAHPNLSGPVGATLNSAFTVHSHEGFDAETRKLNTLVAEVSILLGNASTAIKEQLGPLSSEPEFFVLCGRLLDLTDFDSQGLTGLCSSWVNSSAWQQKLSSYMSPASFIKKPKDLRDALVSGQAVQSALNEREDLHYDKKADAAQELIRSNLEALLILRACIESNTLPFTRWYQRTGMPPWMPETHPMLVPRTLFVREPAAKSRSSVLGSLTMGRKGGDAKAKQGGDYEDEDEDEDEDDEDDDEDEEEHGGQDFNVTFPASQVSAAHAESYMKTFFAPHAINPKADPQHMPKWVFVKPYLHRLWYCERAEWFHPMYITKKVDTTKGSVVDMLNSKALGDRIFSGSMTSVTELFESFKGMDDFRAGGYTCNLCTKRVEPTSVVLWDNFNRKEIVLDFKAAKVSWAKKMGKPVDPTAHCHEHIDPRMAPGRDVFPVVKTLCQGYFCQHRAMHSEALKYLNRCFSVCVDCAMANHEVFPMPSETAVHTADPAEPGDLGRSHIQLVWDDYAGRLDKIEAEFKDKCFSTEVLKRGAPVGTQWNSVVEAGLAAISDSLKGVFKDVRLAPIQRKGYSHVPMSETELVGGLTIEQLETPIELSPLEEENELKFGTPQFTGTIGTFPAFARSQQYFFHEVDPENRKHPYSTNTRYEAIVKERAKHPTKKVWLPLP